MFDIESFARNQGILFKYGNTTKGIEIKIPCPMCAGKDKLWCATYDEVYYCHRCGWSTTDPEYLVQQILNCNAFVAALACNKYQKMKPVKSLEDAINQAFGDEDDFSHNYHFSESYTQQLRVTDIEKPPLELPEYFSPLGDTRMPEINKYAFTRGFSFKLLVEYHVGGCPRGKYYGSLILPVYHGETLVFWQARDALKRNYDEFPKYRTPIGYNSTNVVFNIDIATTFPEVVICEGFFSALRTGRDAVATFGNKISDAQCQLLKDRGVKSVVLCLDPDTWKIPQAMIDRGVMGMKPPIYNAMLRLLDYFPQVRVVKLMGGDPDELGTQQTRRFIEQATTIKNYSDIVQLML